MAVSMNGFVEAVERGAAKTYKGTSRGAMAMGKRMLRNSTRRWDTFEKMAANEGYWKAFQTQVQEKVINGALYGAGAGAIGNTAQYAYGNSDHLSAGDAAGAALRGAIGGGLLGGAIGGVGHFTGNPLRGGFSTRAGAARRMEVAASGRRAAAAAKFEARQGSGIGRWWRETRGRRQPMQGPRMNEIMQGPQLSELGHGPVVPGPMGGGGGRPSFLGSPPVGLPSSHYSPAMQNRSTYMEMAQRSAARGGASPVLSVSQGGRQRALPAAGMTHRTAVGGPRGSTGSLADQIRLQGLGHF